METTKRKYQKHKTDYKIGITYFAEERLKPILVNEKKVYPLYMSVRVKQQITTIRSRINYYSTQDDITNLLRSDAIAPYVFNEKASIEKSVRSLSPDTNESFKISDWYTYYQLGLVCLKDVVINGLFNKLLMHLTNDLKMPVESVQPYFDFIRHGQYDSLVMSELLLKVLAHLGKKKSKALLEQYKLLDNNGLFQKDLGFLPGVGGPSSKLFYKYCLWDVITDNYALTDTDEPEKYYKYQTMFDIYESVSSIVKESDEYKELSTIGNLNFLKSM